MKKLLALLIAILSAVLIISTADAASKPKVTDHEKINIYVFRGSGCSHCHEALTFLYGLDGEYDDYINVVSYEVWYSKENSVLAQAVAKRLNDKFEGVPYIVIGEKSFAGFGSDTGTAMINTALEYYQDSKYKDVVASVIKEGNYESISQTLNQAAFDEGITKDYVNSGTTEEKKNDTWVIIAVFAVIIGGFGALIFTARKN